MRLRSCGVSVIICVGVITTMATAVAEFYAVTRARVDASGQPPSARNQVGSAYDVAHDRLIIFGGNHYGSLNNDVWVLVDATGAAPAWVELHPVGRRPSPRQAVTVGYDAANNRLIVHGGWPGLTDTWVLTGANGLGGTPEWIQLPDGPRRRAAGTGAYDPGSNRLIVFGGADVIGYSSVETLNDTWILTDANGIGSPQWQPLPVAGGSPSPRYYPGSFFDTSTNRLVVHGGGDLAGNLFSDLWVLLRANGTEGSAEWQNLSPPTGPSPRAGHMMTYDASKKRAVLIAGSIAGGYSSETWVLDHGDGSTGQPRWSLATAAGPDFGGNSVAGVGVNPGPMGLSPGLSRVVLALGNDGGAYRNDVWHFDLTGGDITAPTLRLPADVRVEATGAAGAIVTFAAEADDDVEGPSPVTCLPGSGSSFPLGLTTVLCESVDRAGNRASATFSVTVLDTTAPLISTLSTSKTVLWPPNHKMVDVRVLVDASDAVTPDPRCTIASVDSNEPIDDSDWSIRGPLDLALRAERSSADGRVYSLAIDCADSEGNKSRAYATVGVPHDQRKK